MHTEIVLKDLLDRIIRADANELNEIIYAATERFSELYPEWELMTLSVHGHDRESHIKALQDSLAVLSGK